MQCFLLLLKNAFDLFVWNSLLVPALPARSSLLSFTPWPDRPSCFQVGAPPHPPTSAVFVHHSCLVWGMDKLTGSPGCTSGELIDRWGSLWAERSKFIAFIEGFLPVSIKSSSFWGHVYGCQHVGSHHGREIWGSHCELLGSSCETFCVSGAPKTRAPWRKDAPVSAHGGVGGRAGGRPFLRLALLHPVIPGLSFQSPLLPGAEPLGGSAG